MSNEIEDGMGLALSAVAETLTKMDSTLSKMNYFLAKEDERDMQDEEDEQAEEDEEDEEVAKSLFIKEIVSTVMKELRPVFKSAGQSPQGMPVSNEGARKVSGTGWPMSRNSAEDSEKPGKMSRSTEEVQKPLQLANPVDGPGMEDDPEYQGKDQDEEEARKREQNEYPNEEKENMSEVAQLKASIWSLTKEVAALRKGEGIKAADRTEIKKAVEGFAQKVGFKEAGSGSRPKVRLIGDDGTHPVLRKGENATDDPIARLAKLSYRDIADMQLAQQGGNVNDNISAMFAASK